MKWKLVSLLLLLSAQIKSFSQGYFQPLIAKEGISHVIVSGNIDVLLVQDNAENEEISITKGNKSKLKITLLGGYVYLSPAKELATGERLAVFVHVENLKGVTAKGNSFITSLGVIDVFGLEIKIENEARVALRTTGKVKIDAPDTYEIIREQKYNSIYAADK